MTHEKKSGGVRSEPGRTYELYLMRHGIAADRDSLGASDDASRPLTPEGKLKLRASAKGLGRLKVEWDWVITSPLKRAVETGDVVIDELGATVARDTCEALTPGDASAHKVISFLSQHPERSSVLLVGHEPSISQLASELVGASHSANFAFRKGACCMITFDGFPSKSPGLLAWWLTPRLLRKLSS
jgi:phosphohistidine phosphatase